MSSIDEYKLNIHISNSTKSYKFEVHSSDTIRSIKEKLSVLTKVRANNILLLLGGEFLENSATVSEYEIDEDTTLAFEIKLCGPKPIDYDWSQVGVPAAPKKVGGHRGVKKITEF